MEAMTERAGMLVAVTGCLLASRQRLSLPSMRRGLWKLCPLSR